LIQTAGSQEHSYANDRNPKQREQETGQNTEGHQCQANRDEGRQCQTRPRLPSSKQQEGQSGNQDGNAKPHRLSPAPVAWQSEMQYISQGSCAQRNLEQVQAGADSMKILNAARLRDGC
jgi:hypothetical protein